MQCSLDCLPVSVTTEPVYNGVRFAHSGLNPYKLCSLASMNFMKFMAGILGSIIVMKYATAGFVICGASVDQVSLKDMKTGIPMGVLKKFTNIYRVEEERVAFLQNRAGSGYFKNSRVGPDVRVPLSSLITTSAAKISTVFLLLQVERVCDFQGLVDASPFVR